MMIKYQDLEEAIPNPIEIVRKLDEYIIGQEHAKKTLALMLLNRSILKLSRYKKILFQSKLQKSNVLLLGPTGTGKTSLIRALAEIQGVPISTFDVTSITTRGYIGNKIEDMLVSHINNCERHSKEYMTIHHKDVDNSVIESYIYRELLEDSINYGIVYLDEIDKIRSGRGESVNCVFDEGVQNELLKVLENGTIMLNESIKHGFKVPDCGIREIKTDDLIFICGGAFSGLEDIISKRLSKEVGIGFNASLHNHKDSQDKNSLFRHVTTEDLVSYGFKPEFLGRIPLRAVLDPLTPEAMIKIITEPKNNMLLQYTELFDLFGVELEIEKDALVGIAELAIDLKIGARSLSSIFSNLLSEELYNIFEYTDTRLVINKQWVIDKGKGNGI